MKTSDGNIIKMNNAIAASISYTQFSISSKLVSKINSFQILRKMSGVILATAGYDSTIKLWDSSAANVYRTIKWTDKV